MDTSAFAELKVTTEADGAVAVLTLDHGKANECGRAQLRELETLDRAIRADGAVRALIVTSAKVTRSGQTVFVSGANVTERVGWTDAEVKAHVRWQRGILQGLRTLPVFVIMVVDGLALGLGSELLLTADHRIATPRARFGLPETGLGILPGALGTAELASLVGVGNALYLGATGEVIDAPRAREMGLVEALAPDLDAAMALARSVAARVCTRSPRAVAAFKGAVKAGVGQGAPARADLEALAYEGLVDSGEAALGRASFDLIREGKTPPWPPREAG